MRRFAWVLAWSLAGCWAAAPPGPPRTSPPPAAPARGPAPSLRWIDNGFEVTGLPAVTADGRRVVIAIQDGDGARGYPNLRLVAVDRQDAVRDTVEVLAADEVDAMFAGGERSEALDRRIAAANRWLAEVHGRAGLLALRPLAVAGEPTRTRAAGAGLSVTWHHGRLVIERAGARVVERATPASWLAPDRPLCATCAEVCHNPERLEAVHADPPRALALVSISYLGTDTCWEPPTQHHVVAW